MKKFNLIVLTLVGTLCFGVIGVKAEDLYTGEFRKITTDGNWTVQTVQPTSCMDLDFLMTAAASDMVDEEQYDAYAYCTDWSNPDLDDITVNVTSKVANPGDTPEYTESHVVHVTYVAPDVNVKTAVDNVISNLDDNSYILEDLYLINYMNASKDIAFIDKGAVSYAYGFTKEVIKATNGSNVKFKVDLRQGEDFHTHNLVQRGGGMAIAYYDGKPYRTTNALIEEKNIIYIPDTATDYAKAAQDRINAYLGYNAATVVLGGTLESLNEEECVEHEFMSDACKKYQTVTFNASNDFDETKMVDQNYYKITINGGTYNFVIYKVPESELVTPTYLGSDLMSNVAITSDQSVIPLDTALTVNEVTSDEFKKVLGTDKYNAYDISLHSNFKNTDIKKLDNGKFLVSIPVPSTLEEKDIVAIYITSEGKKEEHAVTVKDGMATFETDHFSTYILTDGGVTNPNTGDNIIMNTIIGGISLLGLLGTGLYINKKRLS